MTDTITVPKISTIEELATMMYVKPATVRMWVKTKAIPRRAMLIAGRTYRFDTDMVMEHFRGGPPPVVEPQAQPVVVPHTPAPLEDLHDEEIIGEDELDEAQNETSDGDDNNE